MKTAAENRKMSLAYYLQQRRQTLDNQPSLNSQSPPEFDTQASARISLQKSQTDTGIISLKRPTLTPRRDDDSSMDKRYSAT